MTVVGISDTHGHHKGLIVPPGDILIHAGDFTFLSRQSIREFDEWLGKLPHRCKVVIPGNHEYALEQDPRLRGQFTHATLLIDQATQVAGLNLWGSPVTPLYGGAFGNVSDAARARVWASIPVDTDILITHGPPYGILDGERSSRDHAGCAELLQAVMRVRPRLHIFGHVHGGYVIMQTERTIFVNAALDELDSNAARRPIVIDLGGWPQKGNTKADEVSSRRTRRHHLRNRTCRPALKEWACWQRATGPSIATSQGTQARPIALGHG